MIVGSSTKLNLVPNGVMPVVAINQDDEGYEKQFLIYNGAEPFYISEGMSATIRGKKADGNGIAENVPLTVGSNEVSVKLTQQMTACNGLNIFELVFVDPEGLRVGTINIAFHVERDAMDDAVISESEIGYAETVLTELQSVQAVYNQVVQNKENIAAEVTNRENAVSSEATARQNAVDLMNLALNDEAAARANADNTLQGNINTEATTRAAADANLQQQINQIVSPSGGAPSAAEVQNARIGADGVTYDSLGNAIRKQVSNERGLAVTNLSELNSFNLLDFYYKNNRTNHGVTWTWDGDSVSAVGTATQIENLDIFSSQTSLPTGFVAGQTYKVKYSATNVTLRIYEYISGTSSQLAAILHDSEFTLSENCTGMVIRLSIANGATVNETVTPIIYNTPTNAELNDMIKTYTGSIRYIGYLDRTIFENGSIDASGNDSTYRAKSRYRTVCLCYALGDMHIAVNAPAFTNARIQIFKYGIDGEFLETTGWIEEYEIKSGTCFRIVVTLDYLADADTEYTISQTYAALSVVTNYNTHQTVTVEKSHFEKGGINSSGADVASNARMRSKHIYQAEDLINICIDNSTYAKAGIYTRFYDESGNIISAQGWTTEIAIPRGSYFRLVITLDTTTNTTLYSVDDIFGCLHIENGGGNRNHSIMMISHQGNVCTDANADNANYCKLEGYEKAGVCGFDAAEGDLKFTSDNVPVCAHDNTFVDATTGTTINIYATTLSNLLTHNYHGGTIATLDSIISVCKKYGMDFVLDQYSTNWGDARYTAIFAVLDKYRYRTHVRHIVYDALCAQKILAIDPTAHIVAAQSHSSADASAAIALADSISTSENHIDIMLSITLNESVIADAVATMNPKYGLSIYRCNTLAQKRTAEKYATLITTDMTSGIY